MDAGLIDALAPTARLALAYAPKAAREDWLTLLTLDRRLALVAGKAREPIFAQLQLAWWRDRLGEDPERRLAGEPLIARLAPWGAEPELVRLVDGWEARLAGPPLTAEAIEAFLAGRAAAVTIVARRLGVDIDVAGQHARRWSAAELALAARDPAECSAALAALTSETSPRAHLSRPMRPLAVLEALAVGPALQGRAAPGAGALLAAMRVGMVGR